MNGNTLPKTNIALENGWLEDEFPFGKPYLQGQTVSFREGNKGDLRCSMIFIRFSLVMIWFIIQLKHRHLSHQWKSGIFQLSSCKLFFFESARSSNCFQPIFFSRQLGGPFETCETCSRQMDSRNLNLFRTFLFLANFHETTISTPNSETCHSKTVKLGLFLSLGFFPHFGLSSPPGNSWRCHCFTMDLVGGFEKGPCALLAPCTH